MNFSYTSSNKSTGEEKHVHLKGDGKVYQQGISGRRRTKENSPGDPPRKAKDALKEKEGWDWDANAARQEMLTPNVGSSAKTLFVACVATYEVAKWGDAIILAPETGGASLVAAATTP